MLIQLLSTILLLAGSAVGAGAGNNFNFQNNCNDHSSITAPASPKGAYYNPNGEYGTQAGYLYNYSSKVLLNVTPQKGPSEPQLQINASAQYQYKTNISGGGHDGVSFSTSPKTTPEEYDFYYNGVLHTETAQTNDWVIMVFNSQPTGYIWVFDHKEEPLNKQMNEDIFDVVGDATTASAGIFGNGISAMIALFYANDQITGFGIICLILAGVGLVWFAWRLALALFRRRA